MNEKIPDIVNPLSFAKKKAKFKGRIPLSKLSRLKESLEDVSGFVSVGFEFDMDDRHWVVISCVINTQLQVTCQRCLRTCFHEVSRSVLYSPIENQDSVKDLPEGYEPLVVNDKGVFSAYNLVEDELILSMPIIPLHPVDDCSIKVAKSNQGSEVHDLGYGQNTSKPFEKLAEQINQAAQDLGET